MDTKGGIMLELSPDNDLRVTQVEPLPIGYDNFRAVIEQGLTIVDKSLFIKEFLDDKGTQVALITRPRRFGKSLNLSIKQSFELLLEGEAVKYFIDENFVFTELKANEGAVWSLLLMAGYLKAVSVQETDQGTLCKLQIPNQEIWNLYQKIIEQWLTNGKGVLWYNQFLNYLLTGNIEGFTESLENILLQTASVHDLAREPEAFYQGLMLGLVASLNKNEYEIKSNKESGLGRYDIIIIPKDLHKLAIVLELKSVKTEKKEEELKSLLQQEAELALLQIDKKEYIAEFKQRGLTKALKIGLAFSSKQFHVEANKVG